MNIHSNFEYSFKYSILISGYIRYSIGYLFHFWIFKANIHGYLSKYSFNCSSTWNILFHLEIFSKIFIRSTLVILNIHMNIRFCFWISLGYPGYSHEYSFLILNISTWKEYSSLVLDIPDAPDPSLPRGRPDCFAMLPISHLSWIVVCAFSSG